MDQSRRFFVPGQNRLLAALSRDLQIRLLPRMEKLSVPIRQVLYEADAPIAHVYFPLTGVISLVIDLKGAQSVEVGTIGNEGMLGTPLFLGAERSAGRALCQVSGQALRMRTENFRRAIEEHPEFAALLRRFTQAMINQMSQAVACIHAHSVQQRMCRWLLLTHDRVGSDDFLLTQDLLARTLGVRRPSVTVAAGMLQKAGLIRYQRGHIRIADRAGLEQGACECYETLRQDLERIPLAH
jgi:CRP-like cAMP-binding protein